MRDRIEARAAASKLAASGEQAGLTAIATKAGKSAGKSRAPQELADVEAVARAREGDHEAFRVLVERYQTRIFRLATRILRDEEMARDAVQEIFIKVYGALRKFERRSGFYTWLYRLAYNQCLEGQARSLALLIRARHDFFGRRDT